MENPKPAQFLFVIVKEFKHFLEAPVVMLTRVDYADRVYDSLCEIRTAVLLKKDHMLAQRLLTQFHQNWLDGVSEVEAFQKRIRETPREYIYESVDFTIEAVEKRLKYLKQHMKFHEEWLTEEQKPIMHTEIELVEDMQRAIIAVLKEKKHCFMNHSDATEFSIKVSDECGEILNWLDSIEDSAALRFGELIAPEVSDFSSKLKEPLENIITMLCAESDESVENLVEKLRETQRSLSCAMRTSLTHDLEITKVMEKITLLDERIKKLADGSSALMALQHKKLYLEDRLNSLLDIHMKLKTLTAQQQRPSGVIFNHRLPEEQRMELVNSLEKEWETAVTKTETCDQKSIISILSAIEIGKELYADNYGTFFVDHHGRKLYKNESLLFQLNENNEMVPLSDDKDHVFFYDDCGRYYNNEAKQRIYKAQNDSIEYILDPKGVMYRYREEINGVIYNYDSYGRYYINPQGKKIYKETDDSSEYEDDGLGNLVRLEREIDIRTCQEEVILTEESDYLRRSVGMALKTAISNCLLCQPPDPILFLAKRLLKYRADEEEAQRRENDLKEMMVERERLLQLEREAEERRAEAEAQKLRELLTAMGSEAAGSDSNLAQYETILVEPQVMMTRICPKSKRAVKKNVETD